MAGPSIGEWSERVMSGEKARVSAVAQDRLEQPPDGICIIGGDGSDKNLWSHGLGGSAPTRDTLDGWLASQLEESRVHYPRSPGRGRARSTGSTDCYGPAA